MKKKGFTLIELLAVIIVLAIIALIATPTILNVVENSRKKAFEQTAIGYYDAAKYIYDEMYLNRNTQDVYFTFNNGSQVSSKEGYEIKVKGDKPKGGLVYLTEEGSISVSIHNNKYCAMVEDAQKVRLSENIEECNFEVTEVPESCYLMNAGTVSYDKENESCSKTIGLLIIPSEVNGEKVERIAASGFNNLAIKKVWFIANVTSIGSNAFEGSQLTSINIPSSVTSIGSGAFNNNQLPDDQAFIYKRNSDGTEDKTTIVSYGGAKRDDVVILSGVTIIDTYAFNNNQLTSITIPDSVTTIGSYALRDNQLTSINIPSSVTSIGGGSFNNNQLPDDQAFIYKRNEDGSEDKTTIVSYGGAKRDDVVIPSGVTIIDTYAFNNNQLTSITIPDSVTTIGRSSFQKNQLTSINIPNGVTTIESSAFFANPLTEVTIPESVTTLKKAFSGSLNKVTLLTSISENFNPTTSPFANLQIKELVIGENVTRIPNYFFYHNSLRSLIIPANVKTIGGYAFTRNLFPNRAAITVEGDATRFDSGWTSKGFPAK